MIKVTWEHFGTGSETLTEVLLEDLEIMSTFSAPFLKVGYFPGTSDNVVIKAEEEIEKDLKMSKI